MKLYEQTAKRISKDDVPLSSAETASLTNEIPLWTLEELVIKREFRFKDFHQAMEFVNRVAAIANEQDHHPDLFISYNIVGVNLSTHKVKGLTLNDYIVASKIDRAAEGLFAKAAA
jgi:4a-hydroxytetrahydrobiopterin dehydratase